MSATPTTETPASLGLIEASDKLEEAQRKGDLTAEGALTALADTHRTKLATREAKARIEKECKDALDAAQAAFNNTIEAGLPTKASNRDKADKLDRVVVAHQCVGEKKAENIETIKEIKLEVERAEKAFDAAMEDAYQLRMTFQ